MELKGDHDGLKGPHEPKAQNCGQGHPDQQMYPDGRVKGEFGEQHAKGHNEANDQNYEHGGPVATVRLTKVKAAGLTPFTDL